MRKLRLHVPSFKLFRLLLPLAVLISGITIFVGGMVRTYYVDEARAQTIHEKRFLMSRNDHMEWWVGFLLMANAIFAMVAVVVDKPFPFKLSVFLSGCCLVLILYGIIFDAGEFNYITKNKRLVTFLEEDGNVCRTDSYNLSYPAFNTTYYIRDCQCHKNGIFNLDMYVPFSCELLNYLYYLHAVLSFAMCCAVASTSFVIFSFAFILKRFAEIAAIIDKKPLREDFANIEENLQIEEQKCE